MYGSSKQTDRVDKRRTTVNECSDLVVAGEGDGGEIDGREKEGKRR